MNWYQLYTFAVLDEARINNLSKKHGLDERYIRGHAELDPSHNGKYMPWLLKNHHQIANNEENVYRTLEDLDKFHRHSNTLPVEHRDIMKHTPESLHKVAMNLPSSDRYPHRLPEGATLEHESGPYKFVRIDKPEAAHSLCKGSGWCIGQQGPADATGWREDHAAQYLKKGPLHVIYKNGKRHVGTHRKSGEWRDSQNKELTDNHVRELLKHWS